MTPDLLALIGLIILILVNCICWWIKHLLEIRIKGRAVIIEKFFSSAKELYDYLTEEVEAK